MKFPKLEETRIGVVGLGYVGLPLAAAFAEKFDVVGFDVKVARIDELKRGKDSTREVSEQELENAKRLVFTADPDALIDCNFIVVTVPTPVDEYCRPVLVPLQKASETIGRVLKSGDVVVYESTVYPGATEEDCVPILEGVSGLKCNEDFVVGYSPERINPGDKEHRVTTIRKVTSGSTPEAADYVDSVYASIITAGTHCAPSIRVAEAAKVIENTQRDVNIGLINELAKLFNTMGIETEAVLEAAGTKWNFLPFRPGLVGGHCIGVDPYYLTHKAQALGFHPEMILAGRRVNDGMGRHVASEVVKTMLRAGSAIQDARVLLLGFSFKENCPDLRNTRVIDVYSELCQYGVAVDVYDPVVDAGEAREEYGILLEKTLRSGVYDAVIICVAHEEFREFSITKLRSLLKTESGILYDVKWLLPTSDVDGRL